MELFFFIFRGVGKKLDKKVNDFELRRDCQMNQTTMCYRRKNNKACKRETKTRKRIENR